jgi:hypothetical protein
MLAKTSKKDPVDAVVWNCKKGKFGDKSLETARNSLLGFMNGRGSQTKKERSQD